MRRGRRGGRYRRETVASIGEKRRERERKKKFKGIREPCARRDTATLPIASANGRRTSPRPPRRRPTAEMSTLIGEFIIRARAHRRRRDAGAGASFAFLSRLRAFSRALSCTCGLSFFLSCHYRRVILLADGNYYANAVLPRLPEDGAVASGRRGHVTPRAALTCPMFTERRDARASGWKTRVISDFSVVRGSRGLFTRFEILVYVLSWLLSRRRSK